MYSVPDGASEIGHVALQAGVYEQDHFFLAERYPRTTAVEHYSALFAAWRPCNATDDWDSYPDVSGAEPRFVHQLIRHWVNPQNDVAITLVLRYTSLGLQIRAVPDNDSQQVLLLRLKRKDAEKGLTEIGAKCEKGT